MFGARLPPQTGSYMPNIRGSFMPNGDTSVVRSRKKRSTDHIQPRRGGQREVHVKPRVLGQPLLYHRMVVQQWAFLPRSKVGEFQVAIRANPTE